MKRAHLPPRRPHSNERRISWFRVIPATLFGAVLGFFRAPGCTFRAHRYFDTPPDSPVVSAFFILSLAALLGWAAHRTTPREPRL
jgi:hypothetical protein